MKLTGKHVIDILKRTLDLVDSRLMGHGERVGYMLARMLQTRDEIESDMCASVYVLGMVHDIGAYKTEEIDEMLHFESDDVNNHSIYGYLFVRDLSPLGHFADALLYHHVQWKDLQGVSCENPSLAAVIYLADRMETLLRTTGRAVRPEEMLPYRDTRFSARAIDLFFEADARFDMQNRILDGRFKGEVEQMTERLSGGEAAFMRYLEMAAYAIDFRSETTVTHTITTVNVSMKLARLMGITGDALQSICLGAYLHDLGKVSIPVSIIEKPGRLTSEETEIMRTHVVHSGDIICGCVDEDVYRIATRHHEKMDGSGYPLGLRGEELSLPEQIVAVADIISALCARRSYKEPFSAQETTAILRGMADGGLISRAVVSVAIAHYDAIIREMGVDCAEQIRVFEHMKQEYARLAGTLPVGDRAGMRGGDVP